MSKAYLACTVKIGPHISQQFQDSVVIIALDG